MGQNDARNRGWILDGWPRRTDDAKLLYFIPPASEEGEPELDRTIYPNHVVQIKATVDFLKLRVKELPEHLVSGTHYTEEATVRRFNQYKDWNMTEKNAQPVHDWFKS
jgi:hypothetical protein